jgi:ABC-type nickel/cobalt efflux system permease component RcnA
MSFDFLFTPVEELDRLISGLFDGAPLLVALALAFLLGLRHASDPDHLVAVTSLVAAEDGDTRQAARLGAWWGVGHAGALLALGIPLIALKAGLPGWLESAAERAVGVLILVLAARVIYRWARPRAHLHRLRTNRQALSIGLLHGLAGTGAVVVLLIAALPTKLESALALAVFAPMSMVSMTACTAGFAWVLTRPAIEPLYRTVLVPGLGVFGLMFGLWYAGLPL